MGCFPFAFIFIALLWIFHFGAFVFNILLAILDGLSCYGPKLVRGIYRVVKKGIERITKNG